MKRVDKSFVIGRYSDNVRVKNYVWKTKKGLTLEEEKIIKKYVSKGSSILVVGCGTGREIYGLKKIGFKHVTGVDISPDMIKEAKKILPKVKFYCSDINEFKINKKFNVIIYFNNILEQIPSRKQRITAIAKSKGLLEKKGIIILTTHSCFVAGKFGSELIKNFFLYLLYFMKIRKQSPFDYINEKEKIYAHYSNPFKIKKILKELGFILVEINSKNNIIKNRKPMISWIFDEPIYYVARTC
ncbi:MAG: methyltransferase domain-containing protein [Nanoarchaeota archaeon]